MYTVTMASAARRQIGSKWDYAFLRLDGSLMLCYAIVTCIIIYGYLYREFYRRRSQRDRQVKIKIFNLRRDAGDIFHSITL